MSSNAAPTLVRYVVYMPHGPRSMAFPFNIREDAGVSDLMEVIAQRSAPGFRTSPGARSSHSFQGTSPPPPIRNRTCDLSWSHSVAIYPRGRRRHFIPMLWSGFATIRKLGTYSSFLLSKTTFLQALRLRMSTK